MESDQIKLGFSVGDINGIGLETFLKLFSNPNIFKHCTPVLYATKQVVQFYQENLDVSELSLNVIKDTKDCKADKVNLKIISDQDIQVEPGKSTEAAGKFAVLSLNKALEDVKSGQIDNLVTLPLNKHNIQSENFKFPGHTSFLAEEFQSPSYMMLLVSDELKVGVVTDHIPIQDVSSTISKELIEEKLETLHHSLEVDFGIRKPKIAVLGLNPHSGDQGLIGKEEQEIITPAIEEMAKKGRTVFGPYSADGFFGNMQYTKFDAVLAMYHDQGLIPFKQIAFEKGVNYTAGLPIIRTSPDHGTAYDIAGQGIASFSSLLNAIFLNNKLYHNRIENMLLKKDTLQFKQHRKERFSIGVPNLK